MWHDLSEKQHTAAKTIRTMQQTSAPLTEIRCQICGRLLGKIPVGTPFQFKCPKCKSMNESKGAGR